MDLIMMRMNEGLPAFQQVLSISYIDNLKLF